MALWVLGRLDPEKVWHLLLRVGQDRQERPGQSRVNLLIEEAGGQSCVSHPASPADSVYVLVDTLGKVIVDNMLNSPGKKTK